MSLFLLDWDGCCVRIAAGPVGISPVRKARGPVGIAGREAPFVPLVDGADDLGPFRTEFTMLPLVLSDPSPGAGASNLALRCSSSTSLARFSTASFSRCAFERNLGYIVTASVSRDLSTVTRGVNVGSIYSKGETIPLRLPHPLPSSSVEFPRH